MSYEALVKDVQLLLEMGANFVRGAHYAQDQRFLDLCDLHGLLVWEEVLGWQNTVADFQNPVFVRQSLRLSAFGRPRRTFEVWRRSWRWPLPTILQQLDSLWSSWLRRRGLLGRDVRGT